MCYIYFYDSSITFEPKEDLYEFYYDKNYKNDLIKPPNTLNDLNPNFDYNFYINYYDNITYDISNVYYMSRRIKDLETIEKDTLNYLRVFSFLLSGGVLRRRHFLPLKVPLPRVEGAASSGRRRHLQGSKFRERKRAIKHF